MTNLIAVCKIAAEAGLEAVTKARVVPMVVGESKSLLGGGIDYDKPTYFVEDGVCGFAWVSVRPKNKGNTKLGKAEVAELKAAGFRKNEYEKNYQLWISQFNQSMQKKEAYAAAFAKILRDNGYNAYSGSRMD